MIFIQRCILEFWKWITRSPYLCDLCRKRPMTHVEFGVEAGVQVCDECKLR
jgi:hypothetical protein